MMRSIPLTRIGECDVVHWLEPRPRLELHGHQAELIEVKFAPDGKHNASFAAEEPIRLWDSVAGRELRQQIGGPALWV